MIRPARKEDLDLLTELALQLWTKHDFQELHNELSAMMAEGAAFFLAFDDVNAIGFAQCQLRRDYVEGTSTSPVGYLEGIYVKPEARRKGWAKALLAGCEAWAKQQGCQEFASDCELTNQDSFHFHIGLGFAEANRIICFTKPLV